MVARSLLHLQGLGALRRTVGFRPQLFTAIPNRFQSTTPTPVAPSTRPAPEEKAEALLNLMPGNNLVSKSSFALGTASVLTYIVSKEIYVFDAEFFELCSFLTAYYLWYSNGWKGASDYLTERTENEIKILEAGRASHKEAAQLRIDQVRQMDDCVEVTNGLYDMSEEIAKMEAEVYELQQKVAYTKEVKTVLDQYVRHEASVREGQQKQLASTVIANIQKTLSSGKAQAEILKQALADFERVAANAKA